MNKLIIGEELFQLEEYKNNGETTFPFMFFDGRCFVAKAIPKEKPKEYEILSFKNNGNGAITTLRANGLYLNKDCDGDGSWPIECCNKKYWNIFSLKRMPDGEVFTIGDVCTDDDGVYTYKPIKKFFVNEGVMYAQFNEGYGCNDGCLGINALKKVKQVLFTTEEGKSIFEGDLFWFIDRDFDLHSDTAFNNTKPYLTLKYFSTKEAAEEYIIKNKQIFSIEDLNTIRTQTGCVGSTLISYATELVKERLSNAKK